MHSGLRDYQLTGADAAALIAAGNYATATTQIPLSAGQRRDVHAAVARIRRQLRPAPELRWYNPTGRNTTMHADAPELPPIDQVGGPDAVAMVTDRFYQSVLADPALAPYFADTQMGHQQDKFSDMMVMLLGGEQSTYRDVDDLRERLRAAHAYMGIPDGDYDKVVGHLAATLTDAGVPGDIISEVAGVAAVVREDIVTA